MKRLIIFILIGLPISLGAQTVTVTGIVIDIDTRESIPGVNIINMSTQKGAISDLYGAYTLFEVEIGTVLRFSSIGYDFEEYTVKDDSRINVELISAITELDEIVIVGYGAMKKSDLTGSLSSINRDQIEHTENLTIEETLQGRVPGLQVSGGDGLLGSATSIFIRGVGSVNANTQPLFVVDGFPIEYEYDKEKTILDEEDPLNPLVNLNPDDIASIEVLKDASATAIYGARGANGVILITTKKGESGKTNITLASKWSMNQPVKRLDMLGTPDYAYYMHEKDPNDEYWMEPETFVDSVNTDWQDVVYQNNLAVSQTYDLAIDGGSETTTFRSNLNYSTNSGVVKNTSLDRYSGSIKMNHKAGRWMEMFMDVNLASTTNNSTATGGTGGVPRGFGSVLNALMTPPTRTVDFEVTPEELDDEEDIEGGYTNPLTYLFSVKNTKKNTDLRMNTQMLFKITPSLTIMTRGGYRMGFAERNQYYPSNTGKGKNTNGIGIISGNNKTTLLSESTITYITSINDVHNINAVFGVSYTKTTDYAYDAENTEFGYSDLGFNNLGVGTEANLPGSWYYETSLQSNLGRFNYNYDGRYLATFSYRVDGSSKFGEGNKYAYFPSAAIAWRASEEGFFNDMEWLNNLKIRSSYGVTGNQGIPPYLSKDNYGVSNYVFDNTTISGVQVLNVADPNLKWETSQMIDAGIDFAAFNQRLGLTFDIYHKVTNDMLLAINVPAQSGFLTDWANIGSLLNRGFEASINFDVLRKKSFLWRVNANYSQNENTVLDLADSDHMLFGNYILQEGKPVGAFYGYVTDGIYKDEDEAAAGPVEVQYLSSGNEPGYRRFVDFNDDGIIDNNDRDIIGYGHPDGFGGISNSLRYKGFKLDVFLIYSHGNLIYNATRQKLEDMFGSKGTRNRYSTVTDRWRPPNSYYYGDPGNPEGVLPGITYDETVFHDDYLESGNYLKLKSVNLSYDLPQTYAKMILMKNLRFRINLTNLYTFSDYLGYDPEINMGKNKGLMPGTDNAGAPPSLIISFGITGKF